MTAVRHPAMIELAGHAARIRRHIVDICSAGDGGHLGGSLSLTEIRPELVRPPRSEVFVSI